MHFITLWKAGRAVDRLPGLGRNQEGASTECPGRWETPASRPGTRTWPKFLGGLEAGSSPASALQAWHYAATEGPGQGRCEGGVYACRARNNPLTRVGSGREWRALERATAREGGLDLGAGAARLYRPGQPREVPRRSGQAPLRPCALHTAPRAGLQGVPALSL